MNNINRKEFLRLSSWTFLGSLLPLNSINAFDAIIISNKNLSNDDFKKAQEIAKNAKSLFYKKDFIQAEKLYFECIKLAPRSIQFYDCLSNVYGAKNDLLSSILLFQKGVEINPTIVSFYDRLAHSLKTLEISNFKVAKLYKNKINSSSLLKDSETLLNKAITLDANKKYLNQSLIAVTKRSTLEANVDKSAVARINKNTKETNRKIFYKNENIKTEIQVKSLLNKVEIKKRIQLHNYKEIEHQKKQIVKQKNKYLRILLNKSGDAEVKKLEINLEILKNNSGDSTALKAVKKEYYKDNKFYDFIAIRENFSNKKQTVYSKLGLMDAIQKAFEKNQATVLDLEKAYNIGEKLLYESPLKENTGVDVAIKLCKIGLLLNKHNDCKKIIESLIDNCASNSSTTINNLIYIYAYIFFKEKKFTQAKEILLIGCNEIDKAYSTGEFNKIFDLSKNKSEEQLKEKLILYYLLYNVYNDLNENEEKVSLELKILSNFPKDQFITTKNK